MKRIPLSITAVATATLFTVIAPAQQPGRPNMQPNPPAAPRQYLTLEEVSPYYERPIRQKKMGLAMHDVVTVVVKEQSATTSEGEVDRRKNGLYESVIEDWVTLTSRLTLRPTPQRDGDPTASGTIQQTYRSQSELDVRERMEFRIAATVVDIRPNGNLVVEAHQTITINNEQWDASVSGIIRPDDVLPDNTVLSEDMAEKLVHLDRKGHVRDGYRRGWATRLIDTLNPF